MEPDGTHDEELREAAALAAALDGGEAEGVPRDAALAAALLTMAREGTELPSDRLSAVRDRVMEQAGPALRQRARARWQWLWPAAGAAAAAAAAAVAVALWPTGTETPAVLPAPTLAVLKAQARATHDPEGLGELAGAMGPYRQQMLGSLEERYR